MLPYYLQQWHRFSHVPLAVLAHNTHVRGDGRFHNGIEYPCTTVKLVTRLAPEDCKQLSLGYMDPAEINVREWQGREAEGILYVSKAGEMLYRVREKSGAV